MDWNLLVNARFVGVALMVTGLFYLLEALLRGSETKKEAGTALLVLLVLPLGAFGTVMGVLNAENGTVALFSAALLGILGFILVAKALCKFHWATLIALGVGAAAAYLAWSYFGSALPWYAFGIIGLFVFLLISGILHLVDLLFLVADVVTFPSPILFIIGIIGSAEGVLVLMGLSLSHWF
jgi:hypothetical protein